MTETLQHARLARSVMLVQRRAHSASADVLISTGTHPPHAKHVLLEHTRMWLPRHARAVQRALLIQMLIRPHHVNRVRREHTLYLLRAWRVLLVLRT